MRFASLGSGSRGNGTLVEVNGTCLLVDCGFSLKETRSRLARLGKTPEDLSAVVVTHEHSDHISGAGLVARHHNVPVWMTSGTQAQYNNGSVPDPQVFSHHEKFSIGDIEIQPFPVPHDAREPAQFVFSDGKHRLGLLTDTGSCTQHIEKMITGCDALLLECNHDPDLLAECHYPESTKARISGDLGHLSNEQAADILNTIDHSDLQHIVAMHLSDKNNSAFLAKKALAYVLDCSTDWISVATQDEGLDWREIL